MTFLQRNYSINSEINPNFRGDTIWFYDKGLRNKKGAVQKKPVTPEALAGTVEEMYSNWRNKMYLAAETGNRHLAFMSILFMNHMLSEEIESEYNIGDYDVMNCYDSKDLKATAEAFDDILNS